MKQIIALAFFLNFYNLCFGQIVPELPPNNPNTGRWTSRHYIQNYQTVPSQHVPDGPFVLPDTRTFSYIINTDDIKDYFTNHNSVNDVYFHVYFANDPNDLTRVQLVIVPTVILESDPINILKHDPDYRFAFVPCLYNGETSPNTFCYAMDKFDATIQQSPAQCILSANCPSIAINSTTPVKNWINSYQESHKNTNTDAPTYLQSLTFHANTLRDFLSNNPDVPYLQIYMGTDPQLVTTTIEQYTLVFIGLDQSGNHIPYQTSVLGIPRNMAYEACKPCPICGVEPDPDIDDQIQLHEDRYKKYQEEEKIINPRAKPHYVKAKHVRFHQRKHKKSRK